MSAWEIKAAMQMTTYSAEDGNNELTPPLRDAIHLLGPPRKDGIAVELIRMGPEKLTTRLHIVLHLIDPPRSLRTTSSCSLVGTSRMTLNNRFSRVAIRHPDDVTRPP